MKTYWIVSFIQTVDLANTTVYEEMRSYRNKITTQKYLLTFS